MSEPHFTRIPHWLLPHVVSGAIQSGAVIVYLAIGRYVNYRTGKGAFPSVDTLAADTGISPRSIQRHLKALEQAGAILRTARYVRGRQTSNLIQLVTSEPSSAEPNDTGDTPGGDTGVTLTRSIEQDAAAVSEVPEQAAADDEREDLRVLPCDNDEPHAKHSWWADPDENDLQQHWQCEGVTVEEIEQASADIAAAAHAADIGLDEPGAYITTDGIRIVNADGVEVVSMVTQQQPEEQADVTMDEAIGIVEEVLQGTVVEDVSHGETPGLPVHDPDGPRVQYHGTKNRPTVADDPRVMPPFPGVAQHNLVGLWNVQPAEGARWEAAWQTADMTTARAVPGDEYFYDAETHLMGYLMRCKHENRAPRPDLWLRFYVEDRAKHIQTLRDEHEARTRREEDPADREMRSNTTLPPAEWGVPEEG